MTTSNQSIVVGVFEKRCDAEQAVEDLYSATFTYQQIGFVMRDRSEMDEPATTKTVDDTAGGILGGAVAGSIAGSFWGLLTALVIPGFGPAIAAGILVGALLGGSSGGLLGALMGLGVSEEDAEYYQHQFEQGHAIITVKAGSRREEALAILRNNAAYDTTTRKENTSSLASPHLKMPS